MGIFNIIRYCNRPWTTVEEMNEALVSLWNETVPQDAVVYHLGDAAMGKLDDSLALIGRLHGTKHLIAGNHDRCYRDTKQVDRYLQAGFETVTFRSLELELQGHTLLLSHTPYENKTASHDDVRPAREKDRLIIPKDEGLPLICGHVHDCWKLAQSLKWTPMLNVGVDAWDYKPVSLALVLKELGLPNPKPVA